MDGVIRTYTGPPKPDDPPSNPFDTEAVGFLVTKPLNVAQLRSEIRETLDCPEAEVATQNTIEPGTCFLFVTPPLDMDDLDAIIADHQEDPNWGRKPLDPDVVAARDKVLAGETLDTTEISILLRYLLHQVW